MSVLEKFSLAGRTALVTGGAGLYGRQIVEALAEAGAEVYMASRNLEALEQAASSHRKAGRKVVALQMDQGEEASILAARDILLERSGRIDVLINNAVLRPMKSYHDDAAAFARSMEVNATGLFMITRAVGEVMQAGGSIINVGSIQGMVGPDPTNYRGTDMNGFIPDYFFHKGGMINFTCISPGGFQTESQPEAFVRQYSDRTMLGRLAGDEDLKGIIVFLASAASSYITGANIPVDGGYTAK
jgi:NAD(P)-dependent dehydrogenase (short-subunit alcohol dehydrogenase family)